MVARFLKIFLFIETLRGLFSLALFLTISGLHYYTTQKSSEDAYLVYVTISPYYM